jgi:hypothetical protein
MTGGAWRNGQGCRGTGVQGCRGRCASANHRAARNSQHLECALAKATPALTFPIIKK